MLEIGDIITCLCETDLEMSLFASLASLVGWYPGHCEYYIDAGFLAVLRS